MVVALCISSRSSNISLIRPFTMEATHYGRLAGPCRWCCPREGFAHEQLQDDVTLRFVHVRLHARLPFR